MMAFLTDRRFWDVVVVLGGIIGLTGLLLGCLGFAWGLDVLGLGEWEASW